MFFDSHVRDIRQAVSLGNKIDVANRPREIHNIKMLKEEDYNEKQNDIDNVSVPFLAWDKCQLLE